MILHIYFTYGTLYIIPDYIITKNKNDIGKITIAIYK